MFLSITFQLLKKNIFLYIPPLDKRYGIIGLVGSVAQG